MTKAARPAWIDLSTFNHQLSTRWRWHRRHAIRYDGGAKEEW